MSDEIEPHIFKKFEILQKLGKGAYGIVWKAIEKKTKRIVALKKVFEAFHNDTDAQRTFREVMILQELNNHENVIKLINVIKAENKRDLYLVFEFMETDLHAVIKAGILKKEHKQYIIYQLLKGLKYIHSGEIVHRDLKPSNLLVNSECLVKIGDFGLARSVSSNEDESDPIMTEYVATRWYRAPEIVLGSNKYSKSVDVWSVGCILAELINEKALFPGKSTYNQIELIVEVLGKPTLENLQAINSHNAMSILSSISTKRKTTFSSFFRDNNPVVIDFLKRCLEFNPEKRITIDEALAHEFVRPFREQCEETIHDKIVLIKINDNIKLSTKDYREALYNDIIQKKKDQRKQWRQTYLQQLGININSESVKKDLLKNLMNRNKDVTPQASIPIQQTRKNDVEQPKEVKTLHNSKSIDGLFKRTKEKSEENKFEVGANELAKNTKLKTNEPKIGSQNQLDNTEKKSSIDPKNYYMILKEKHQSVGKASSNMFSKPGVVSRDLLSKPPPSIYESAKSNFESKSIKKYSLGQNVPNALASNGIKSKPQSFQKLSSYYHSLLTNANKSKNLNPG